MDIRDAALSDAPEISRLVSKLASTHVGPTLGVGGVEKLLESMDVESTIKRMAEGYPHWVAVDGDAIVGVAVVQPPSHIHHLFVRADRQRSGIGRLLLNEALQFISDNTSAAKITVNSSLNAVDVYRRFGFSSKVDPVEVGGVRFLPMCQTYESRSE